MNQQETEQLVKKLFADEEYVKGLVALETPEEVQASLKEQGLECSVEDIMKIKDLLPKFKDGELNDEELESVSGGSFAIGVAAVLGVCAGLAALGGIGLGIDTAIRRRW